MIRQLWVDGRSDRHGTARAKEERVAVRGLRGRVFCGEASARSGLVLDYDRLADLLGELVADQTCE